MNILEKIYCRTFQFGFKVAIPFLPYRNPIILDTVDDVSKVFKQKNINKVMIVIDKSVRALNLSSKLEKSLSNNNISVVIFDDIVSNPTINNVERARDIYIENNCQALIGFGGGSAIDCAKAVGARIARPKKTIPQMAGILTILKQIPLLVAIPTTAGTGSETTVATLITDSETKRKYMIGDFPLIPRYAILDAENIKTLPPRITACVGLDVLVHATEAYIGNSTTKKTREQALKAISLVYQNLYGTYINGNDLAKRKNMLYASYLAGCAFTVSYVGYCHAIAHALGGLYNIPHGFANAVIIPYFLEAYGEKIHKKLKKLGIAAGLFDETISEKDGALQFIQSIKDLNSKMGIGTKIDEIKNEDVDKIVAAALKEGNPVYPVPILMGKKELSEIVYKLIK